MAGRPGELREGSLTGPYVEAIRQAYAMKVDKFLTLEQKNTYIANAMATAIKDGGYTVEWLAERLGGSDQSVFDFIADNADEHLRHVGLHRDGCPGHPFHQDSTERS